MKRIMLIRLAFSLASARLLCWAKLIGLRKDPIIVTIWSAQQGDSSANELSGALLKTLTIISHRATHFLPFLIIIMVINVYKLESLRQNERTAGAERQRARGGSLDVAGC